MHQEAVRKVLASNGFNFEGVDFSIEQLDVLLKVINSKKLPFRSQARKLINQTTTACMGGEIAPDNLNTLLTELEGLVFSSKS